MSRKMMKRLEDESGAALVIALLMMITLTLIGLGSIFTSTFEVKLSGNKRGATDAFYAADGGIQIIMANIRNFDVPGKYVDNKYDPFTDPSNPNPTGANVEISHFPDQHGSPRGMGFSAVNFEFYFFGMGATGRDQADVGLIKSTCAMEEKVVRIIPTLQGGY